MRQPSLFPSLASDLKTARRSARLTQSKLASQVGISVPTLRTAERGEGGLETFVRLAAVMDREITGRSLPPGGSLGERLQALRARRKLGRRVLAQMAGISPTTLAAVERDDDVHLATVIGVAVALGVQLRLQPRGAPVEFWTATAASSAHDGWRTPPEVLEHLYRVVGSGFDLDPCSPMRAGPVRARLRYTADDDGLELPWNGVAFMNPPYGRSLSAWVAKAHAEAEAGRAVVFGLVPARTDTAWWHEHIAGCADVWFLRGRLSFGGQGGQSAPFPSAIIVWGAADGYRERLAKEFPSAWHVAGVGMRLARAA